MSKLEFTRGEVIADKYEIVDFLDESPLGLLYRTKHIKTGKYVRLGDPEYKQPWTRLPLRDDGKEGDVAARDGVFSARVPGAVQRHRWLGRYRVVAEAVHEFMRQALKPGQTVSTR